MSRNWKTISIGEAVDFNPKESIKKGTIAKKIAMGQLTEFERKINGFEYAEYKGGPKFRNKDTLVARITPSLENGKTAQVNLLGENELAFGSTEFIVLRANQNTVDDFVFYLAKSPTFREKAISCMEGTSGRRRVNENVLKTQLIKLPDLPTQKAIAKVLSDLDAKIELNNKINRELEAMAKTLYDYWFVQFDFPNEQGKPYKSSGGKMVYNKELKQEIPVGWEVGTLDSIGTINGGSTPSKSNENNFCVEDGTPWITPKDLSLNKGNKYITRGEFDVTENGIKEASLKVMPKGTVLLSSRAPIGYLAISRGIVSTNQGFKSFVPKSYFSTEYIYYTVKNSIKIIEAYSSGSTFKEISSSVLKTIKIYLPQKNVIEKYNQKVVPIFEKQNLLELENQQLTTLRDWLLPMLMNGQVAVGEAEEKLSMAAEPQTEYKKG